MMAKKNPFRFSTKRSDDTTDLVLYEYRAYCPTLGRWPNRDPLEECGRLNLYGFVRNNPVNAVDLFGLADTVTIGVLACIRSGNPPAFCVCLFAPDSEECEKQLGACINAIGKIPNPKTGRLNPPNPADICKCGSSILFPDDAEKRKEFDAMCDKIKPPKCERKEKPLPDISIPDPPRRSPPGPPPPPHRRK